MSLPVKVDGIAGALARSAKMPWELVGQTAEEFVPDFVEDMKHIAQVLRGEVSYRGLKGGTVVTRVKHGLQLVQAVCLLRDARDLHVVASQARLLLSQQERNRGRTNDTVGVIESRGTCPG